MSSLHLDPYEELANAVILQAVKDYRDALKTLSKNPMSIGGNKVKGEVERFFHSRQFSIYTDLDPNMLLRKLNEEVAA